MEELIARYLKPRARQWHKGLSGHVLIIGGECGFSGAPHMAAEAALRVGAGLVSVATRKDHADLISVAVPEVMSHGVEQADALLPLAQKATVLVVGPGLGQLPWGKKMWQTIYEYKLPRVIDADGLNLLAQEPVYDDNWILTPHPGEAARLLNITTEQVQLNRQQTAEAIAKKYGGVCVLKGAGTIVYQKDHEPYVCDKGNPGMATAGMGDVLSGVLGGLIAQGIPLFEAAKIAVYIHAVAGDRAAAENGERGIVATDLMPYLQQLVNLQ
jgi:hydroxyethylthiazole kinase-like uncharacterized protein yjeF